MEAARNLNTPDFSKPEVKQLIAELTAEHVIVEMSALHHGMGDKFPLDNCKFYGKYSPDGGLCRPLPLALVHDRCLED